MDNILLIIYDFTLRQLYHELLLTKNIEIIPCNTIENAVLLLTLTHIAAAIVYSDDINKDEIEAFLNLRTTYEKWQKIPLILLSLDTPEYHRKLLPIDTLIIIGQLTPEIVSEEIKEVVKKIP
jgi:hypothetical protein